MLKNNIILSGAALVLLFFAANSTSAQCGADGRQPCKPTTPTTPTTKKTTSQPTVTKPPVVKKTQANPLKSKLVGKWRYSDGLGAIATYYSNNTGKLSEDEKVCATIKFTLTGNIFVEKIQPTNLCEGYEKYELTSRIEITGDKLSFFVKNDDGTYSDDPGVWIRVK